MPENLKEAIEILKQCDLEDNTNVLPILTDTLKDALSFAISKLSLLEQVEETREIQNIFLKLGKRVQIDDKENLGHWRWAWIIDYDDLAQAIITHLTKG